MKKLFIDFRIGISEKLLSLAVKMCPASPERDIMAKKELEYNIIVYNIYNEPGSMEMFLKAKQDGYYG